MSRIIINRIKSYLDRTLKDKIDLSDLSTKPEADIQKNFYSRALAAYSLIITAGISSEDAANSVTDGFDDNGLDAIYFDSQAKYLWLVQSKFIESGTGGVDTGDIEKFSKGVKKLIDGDFSRFNTKIRDMQDEIFEALDDASVKIQIVFAYTGNMLSSHNTTAINDLLNEQNETDEILLFTDFNIEKAYKGLETGTSSTPINEDILISNWGLINEPFKSYYGQITGSDLGILWEKHGKRLFTENIRNFLGTSTVNEEILKTIKTEPENFIYFNNGITILCESIRKKPIGGNDKAIGAFTCNGMSVVNGAQTLGSIGSLIEFNSTELANLKVFVKFISLEESPSNFGQRITIATNTQNKVEKKDFVSLDGEQARIKLELKLEGIDYHYKRSNEKIIADDTNYLLEEVSFSLASLWHNVDYSTMIKKESGKLWTDVSTTPYTDIFNPSVSAHKIIKAVKVYRFVLEKLNALSSLSWGREKSIYRYGNSLICHLIYQKMRPVLWSDTNTEFDSFYRTELNPLADTLINSLKSNIETEYPDSMIVYILRNYTKCRHLKSKMI